MTNRSDYKVTCTQCEWKGHDRDLLHAPNPFDPLDVLNGCPGCKAVDSARVACDAPNCWRDATCGTPTPDGYRHTCYKHRPEGEQP